jgi:hypothetical protein
VWCVRGSVSNRRGARALAVLKGNIIIYLVEIRDVVWPYYTAAGSGTTGSTTGGSTAAVISHHRRVFRYTHAHNRPHACIIYKRVTHTALPTHTYSSRGHTDVQIQVYRYRCADTDAQIQMHRYRCADTDTDTDAYRRIEIQVYRYRCTDTGVQLTHPLPSRRAAPQIGGAGSAWTGGSGSSAGTGG